MKYRQACNLKNWLDNTIEKLTWNVAGPGATDAARTRLSVVHVSLVCQCYVVQADLVEKQQNMAELEERTATMAWDWSRNDIAEDEDDGRAWVPVTPMTLNTGERGREKAAGQARQPSTGREQTSRARVSEPRDTTPA